MSDITAQISKLLVPAAQVIGLSASGCLTGFGYGVSFISIPVILSTCPDNLLAKQWYETYKYGKAAAPPLAGISAICFGYLATQSRNSKGFFPDWSFDPTAPWALYTLAAVALPSIVPYTLGIMMSTTVNPLESEAVKPGSMSVQETRRLIAWWAEQNNVRQSLGAIGGLAALAATLLR